MCSSQGAHHPTAGDRGQGASRPCDGRCDSSDTENKTKLNNKKIQASEDPRKSLEITAGS